MMHRLNAGYRVDKVRHNAALSTRFMHSQSQYSQKNGKTLLMQGTKVFWQLLSKLTNENFELEVDKSQKAGSGI